MKWIKGNHPKKTNFTGIINCKIALTRFQIGKNNIPCYRINYWMGDRWTKRNTGANIITHYVWTSSSLKENLQFRLRSRNYKAISSPVFDIKLYRT